MGKHTAIDYPFVYPIFPVQISTICAFWNLILVSSTIVWFWSVGVGERAEREAMT